MDHEAVEISQHALDQFVARFAERFGAPPPEPEERLRSILRQAVLARRGRAIFALLRYKQPATYFMSDGWGLVLDEECKILLTVYRLGYSYKRDSWLPAPKCTPRKQRR